jgi:hypothetical protein
MRSIPRNRRKAERLTFPLQQASGGRQPPVLGLKAVIPHLPVASSRLIAGRLFRNPLPSSSLSTLPVDRRRYAVGSPRPTPGVEFRSRRPSTPLAANSSTHSFHPSHFLTYPSSHSSCRFFRSAYTSGFVAARLFFSPGSSSRLYSSNVASRASARALSNLP